VSGPALAGDQTERQFDKASDQHGNRDQQPDLRVAQPEIGADQRQRGTLGTVGQLIDELDRQRNGNGCDAQESAMSATAAVAAITKRAQPANKPARAGCGISDRSTSHGLIVTPAAADPAALPTDPSARKPPKPSGIGSVDDCNPWYVRASPGRRSAAVDQAATRRMTPTWLLPDT
jgi:hypothetical protein